MSLGLVFPYSAPPAVPVPTPAALSISSGPNVAWLACRPGATHWVALDQTPQGCLRGGQVLTSDSPIVQLLVEEHDVLRVGVALAVLITG